MNEWGTLYLCGTPIGNIRDMTYRAVDTLKEVDIIAAEDTRQSIKLLNYYNIKTPLTSYHEHNKASKGPKLIEELKSGKNIALVTDAGMPAISDPGQDLVKLCYKNGITVTAVPGATAVVTGLVLSGLDTRSYAFEGFLPPVKKQRRQVLERLAKEERTAVLYEAPHHLTDTLKELSEALGDRKAVTVRELTKKYEQRKEGTLSQLVEYYEQEPPKGEFVIVIEGYKRDKGEEYSHMSVQEHFEQYLTQGLSEKDAMKAVAKERGIGKSQVYAIVKGDKDNI